MGCTKSKAGDGDNQDKAPKDRKKEADGVVDGGMYGVNPVSTNTLKIDEIDTVEDMTGPLPWIDDKIDPLEEQKEAEKEFKQEMMADAAERAKGYAVWGDNIVINNQAANAVDEKMNDTAVSTSGGAIDTSKTVKNTEEGAKVAENAALASETKDVVATSKEKNSRGQSEVEAGNM